jgi:hypothetical protein
VLIVPAFLSVKFKKRLVIYYEYIVKNPWLSKYI